METLFEKKVPKKVPKKVQKFLLLLSSSSSNLFFDRHWTRQRVARHRRSSVVIIIVAGVRVVVAKNDDDDDASTVFSVGVVPFVDRFLGVDVRALGGVGDRLRRGISQDFHRRAWPKSDYVGDKRDIEKKDHDSGEFCERRSMVRGRSDELPSSIPGESDDEVERTARERRAVRFGFGL